VSVISRACALWLIVLILTPFSAPFSVCDVSTFFQVKQSAPPSPLRAPRSKASADDTTGHALPAARVMKRDKAMDAPTRVLPRLSISSTSTNERRFVSRISPSTSPTAPLRI
jgi:hypothetical protein